MINNPGNPASYPANVRTIEDGDLRNATNLAAATEDLTDRTANLNSRLGAAKRLKEVALDFRDKIAQTATSSTWTEVKDASGTALDMVATSCAVGDYLDIYVGPLKINVNVATGTYGIGVVAVEVTHGASIVDYIYEIDAFSGAAVNYYPFSVTIPFSVTEAVSHSVKLWAAYVGDGTGSTVIWSPTNNHTATQIGWPDDALSQVWGRILHFGAGA